MEKDSPSKPSVAELAGRFKGHILPMPTTNDEIFKRRPPCSLKLNNQKDDHEGSDKTIVSPNPFKIKMRSSPIIEKLQANLALSPTSLLPTPKSPEVKLQPAAPLSPPSPPASPQTPRLRPPSEEEEEEEDPVGFDGPPEGATLPSFNKTRARLSFKRRPPTRQHRRSASEEGGASGSGPSPSELSSPKENGDGDQVFESPAEQENGEEPKHGHAAVAEEDAEVKDTDSDKMAEGAPDPEGQEAERAHSLEPLEEEEPPLSEPCPAQQVEGAVETEAELHQTGRPGV